MPRPSNLLPTTGEVSMLALVTQMNDWLESIKGAWPGPDAPPNPVNGQLWLSGGIVRIRVSGTWRVLMHDGVQIDLGTTPGEARTRIDVAQKQASLYSGIADRAMLLGAFGLGGDMALAPNNRLNQIARTGFYAVDSATLNVPEPLLFGSACAAFVTNANFQLQLLGGRRASAGFKLWHRFMVSASWVDWKMLAEV